MYWTFILLVGFSATFGLQVNTNLGGLHDKRFLTAAFFGDSGADTGNVFELTNGTWPIHPPYYRGQYSNGPCFAYDLNVFLKCNYAYGSATTDNNLVEGRTKESTVLVPDILQQVTQYLSDFKLPFALEHTVHIVWGGANDFIGKPVLAVAPQLIIESLMKSVKALLVGGAKQIIVFNQEPLQNVPRIIALGVPRAALILLTDVLNILTKENLQAIQAANPQAKLYLFDLHSLIANLHANPPPPVTHTTSYCWNATSITTVVVYCQDPETYFFIDPFHFANIVQQKLAQAVDKFFDLDFEPSPNNYFYSF